MHLDIGRDAVYTGDFPDADVMVLAGDIAQVNFLIPGMVDSYLHDNVSKFIHAVSAKYKKVLWIPGNHEYYDSSINQAELIVDKWLKSNNIDNVVFSSKHTEVIDNVKFIMATLWTDLNNSNPIDMNNVSWSLNDYRKIMHDGGYLRPFHTVDIHRDHKNFIRANLAELHDKSTVVITHHAPNSLSDDTVSAFAAAYCCRDMDDIIYIHAPDIWIHGHTHKKVEYELYDTVVVSNPRGYVGYEPMAHNFQIEVFDIE
jgi:Icc-related predicted phosphoesterase